MAILNPSFEDAGAEAGMAEHWTLATSVAGQRIAGFGPPTHRGWEDFERWVPFRRAFAGGDLAMGLFDSLAKGVEDCSFYRWSRLTSLNEVGADPSVFAVDAATFHEALAKRQREWPHAMTTTSTHDTKRAEDVRARIAVLAEMGEGARAESIVRRQLALEKPSEEMDEAELSGLADALEVHDLQERALPYRHRLVELTPEDPAHRAGLASVLASPITAHFEAQ